MMGGEFDVCFANTLGGGRDSLVKLRRGTFRERDPPLYMSPNHSAETDIDHMTQEATAQTGGPWTH